MVTGTESSYIEGMSRALSPIESEFTTVEEAAAHDRWFRAKVEAALASTQPSVPHDEAMARLRALIDEKR
ncbi:type II toxin-antitoxin system RelB family antitoxin [Inquilinus sp. CA228]|uniref:type II toxin-antitoxin system RelB family antitoxin n=1 Tax=Inquilinus sp. CA228 TaxID=3455609 RepID=UPI003F8D4247